MTQDQTSEQYKIYNRLVARSWNDPAFKARLMATPEAVIREAGGTPPAGVMWRAVEVAAGQVVDVPEEDDAHGYVFIPVKPEGIDDDNLGGDDVAGYFSSCVSSHAGPTQPPAGTPPPIQWSNPVIPTSVLSNVALVRWP